MSGDRGLFADDQGGAEEKWNTRVLGDEVVCDILDELLDSDFLEYSAKAFKNSENEGYLSFYDSYQIIVCAAVIDSVINSIEYHLSEVDDLIAKNTCLEFGSLKDSAAEALGQILSDHSELYEIWEERDECFFDEWEENIRGLISRLS